MKQIEEAIEAIAKAAIAVLAIVGVLLSFIFLYVITWKLAYKVTMNRTDGFKPVAFVAALSSCIGVAAVCLLIGAVSNDHNSDTPIWVVAFMFVPFLTFLILGFLALAFYVALAIVGILCVIAVAAGDAAGMKFKYQPSDYYSRPLEWWRDKLDRAKNYIFKPYVEPYRISRKRAEQGSK